MRLYGIAAIVRRHIYLFPRSFDRFADAFFWPVVELLFWCMALTWMSQEQNGDPSVAKSLLFAIVLWRVVFQASYEVANNFLEECWNRNLTNMIACPLTKSEWVIANVLVAMVKGWMVLLIGIVFLYLINGDNLFEFGLPLLPLIVVLMISGWSFGFVVSSVLLRLGLRAQALGWTVVFLFGPLSAVYCPVSSFPGWMQPLVWSLPPTAVFEYARAEVLGSGGDLATIVVPAVSSVIALILSLVLFNAVFESTRRRGFDHLE